MEIFYIISKALIFKTQNITNSNNKNNKNNNNNNELINIDIINDPFLFYLNNYLCINKSNEEGYIILNMIHDIYQLSSNKKNNSKNKDTGIKIKPKFKALESVFNNIFMSYEFKEKYFNIFSKLQKINYNLKRFGYICKLKKMKLQVDCDLLLNPISLTNNVNTICIVQENFKYMFTLVDLINIIETALTNAPGFFVEVLTPKNPYNNIPFSLSCLYNIYFKIKNSNIKTSILFHLFFLCNFNKSVFSIEYEAIIRDHAIKNFVYNTPAILLRKFVHEMLNNNYYTKKLSIDKDLPDNTFLKIMRPFLYYYYISKYSIPGTEKISLYNKILYYKLKLFYKYNPKFGRKYYHITDKIRHASFNTKCILFDNININECYLNSSSFEVELSNFYSYSYNNSYNNSNNDNHSVSTTSMSHSLSSESESDSEVEVESELEWIHVLNELSSNLTIRNPNTNTNENSSE